MQEFFLAIWMSLMSFLGFASVADVQIETQAPSQEVPSGTPAQSAPASAVQACSNKKVKVYCSFTLNENELRGICVPSGAQLACTPVLPQ